MRVCVSNWGHVWAVGGLGYKGTSGNRDSHLASRSALNDFIDDALTIAAGS